MILSDNDDAAVKDTGAPTPETEKEVFEPAIIRFSRLFARDIWCWVNAIRRQWWLFAIFPLLFACVTFFIRTMTTTNVFKANCGLIRQTIADSKSDILPPGYANVPKSNVEKLFTSRAVLEETVKRLSLPYTYEQLYNNISVTSDKNGDYYYLSATSTDSVLAATLANTLSEVFIDEYKKLIRGHLEDLNDSNVKTQNVLERELAEKNEALERIYAANNISDIDNDIAYNTQQLLSVEDQLRRASATLESSKQALYALQGELANTPEQVVSYRETSTIGEDELMRAQAKLSEYEQMYAKSNPILIQQREVVKKLQAELEKAKAEDENGENDINRKVIVSLNPAYTQINVNIATKNAEIASLNNEITLNNEAAIQLRARRELLTKNQVEIRQIKADIDQSKKQIAATKAQTATIQNFLDRSYSDISIQELAKPPNTPLKRKRGVWAVIGFVLGSFVSLAIILMNELFNLTVRSNVDVEQALRIKMLGMIPVLEQAHRANYYSALQTMISNGEPFFEKASPDHPLLLVFAPNKRSDLDEKTKTEFCETLKIRLGSKYVIISPIIGDDVPAKQMPLLINDYLYQFTDEAPKPGKDRAVYFRLDDLSFISPLTDDQIRRVKTAYKSTALIVWDLFDFELHRQLFAEIARNADMTIIPMKYAQTSKLSIYRILQFLKSFHVRNIVGFLYNVDNKHYNKVTL